MPRISANEAAEKWGRRTQAAVQDYRAGVERVTDNPAERAIRQQNLLLQNFQRAVSEGRWRAGLERVTLDEWKRAASEKGSARLAQGVQEAQPKVREVFQDLFAHIAEGERRLEQMPRGTLDQNIQRMVAWARHMAQFRRRG